MLGIFIELALSWLLLWLFGRNNLSALGFKPTAARLVDLFFGFMVAGTCCSAYFLTITFLTDNEWMLNPAFSGKNFVDSSWWTVRSVLFEELIFRGAILYILIQKVGVTKACLISATAFGIYHWFSYQLFGNPMQMVYIFLSTGIFGYILALSFARTASLYLPVSIHFGWNLFNIVVFSQGPLGQQFFVLDDNGHRLTGLPSILLLLFQVFSVPVIVYLYLKRYYKKQQPVQVDFNSSGRDSL